MRRISARSTRIVKAWGPRVALLLACLFLVLAGVMFFVVGIGNLFSLLPTIFMSIVYVGIRKTLKDLADEVLIGSGGLVVRSGKAREWIPFETLSSARYEKRKTSGVMVGTLPVIRLISRGGNAHEKEFTFVPKTPTNEIRPSTMDESIQLLVENLQRRAENARGGQ